MGGTILLLNWRLMGRALDWCVCTHCRSCRRAHTYIDRRWAKGGARLASKNRVFSIGGSVKVASLNPCFHSRAQLDLLLEVLFGNIHLLPCEIIMGVEMLQSGFILSEVCIRNDTGATAIESVLDPRTPFDLRSREGRRRAFLSGLSDLTWDLRKLRLDDDHAQSRVPPWPNLIGSRRYGTGKKPCFEN
jgi:hypothetical protein